MKFHDELNPKLWEDNKLKPEVADKLREIANAFIEYMEIDEDAVEDVVITGSSASYNYTPHSDLDLHLKIDYDKIHEDCPIVEGFLWALKATFNKDHDISIYGVPVEVYAESIDSDTVHNGLYSIWLDEWIDLPKKIPPTDNDAAVQSKYEEIKEAADRIEDSEVAEELINKIYEMRKAGLNEVGEFSTENLAFKKLRDNGILDKLKQMKKEKIDNQLSLESYNESENELSKLEKIFSYLPKFDSTKYINFENNRLRVRLYGNLLHFYSGRDSNEFEIDLATCKDKDKFLAKLKKENVFHPATQSIAYNINNEVFELVGEVDLSKHTELYTSDDFSDGKYYGMYLHNKTGDEIFDAIIANPNIKAYDYDIIKETPDGTLISLFDRYAWRTKKYIYKDGRLNSSRKAIRDFLSKNESIKEDTPSKQDMIKALKSFGCFKSKTEDEIDKYYSEEEIRKEFTKKYKKQFGYLFKNESIKEEFFVGNDKYIIVPVSYAYNDIRILDKKTGEFLKDENGDNLKFATEEECGDYIKALDKSATKRLKESFKEIDAVQIAFPKLSAKAKKIIANWYYNEDAIMDFDNAEDFAKFMKKDIKDMIDAADATEEAELVNAELREDIETLNNKIDKAESDLIDIMCLLKPEIKESTFKKVITKLQKINEQFNNF